MTKRNVQEVALEVTKRDMWSKQRAAREWAEEY